MKYNGDTRTPISDRMIIENPLSPAVRKKIDDYIESKIVPVKKRHRDEDAYEASLRANPYIGKYDHLSASARMASEDADSGNRIDEIFRYTWMGPLRNNSLSSDQISSAVRIAFETAEHAPVRDALLSEPGGFAKLIDLGEQHCTDAGGKKYPQAEENFAQLRTYLPADIGTPEGGTPGKAQRNEIGK